MQNTNTRKGSKASWAILIILLILAITGYFYFRNRQASQSILSQAPVRNPSTVSSQSNTPAVSQTSGKGCDYLGSAALVSVFGPDQFSNVSLVDSGVANNCSIVEGSGENAQFLALVSSIAPILNQSEYIQMANGGESVEGMGDKAILYTTSAGPVITFVVGDTAFFVTVDKSISNSALVAGQLALLVASSSPAHAQSPIPYNQADMPGAPQVPVLASTPSGNYASVPVDACQYISSADASSIFGSAASNAISPSDDCTIILGQNDRVATIYVADFSGTSTASMNGLYSMFKSGGQAVQGVGDSATEIQSGAGIAFMKGSYNVLVTVDPSVSDNTVKAMQLAKLIAIKI